MGMAVPAGFYVEAPLNDWPALTFRDHEVQRVGFTAPVDLEADDVVILDVDHGDLISIVRARRVVWQDGEVPS
jgi:hypothetical protein